MLNNRLVWLSGIWASLRVCAAQLSPSEIIPLQKPCLRGHLEIWEIHALGKQREKPVGHWIVANRIKKREGFLIVLKVCFYCCDLGRWIVLQRLLPWEADLGMQRPNQAVRLLIPPCSPWSQPTFSSWNRQDPFEHHPLSLPVPKTKCLLHPWVACLALGEVWKRENLRFPLAFP